MKITKEMLKKIGICSDQYELFCKMFPDGAEINRENVVKAQPDLDIRFIFDDIPHEMILEILRCSNFKLHYRNWYGYECWCEYDENGGMIHYRDSDGYEWWREYDQNGNEIHYRDSIGYEAWGEYDQNGGMIHHWDSDGDEWFVCGYGEDK